MGKKSGINLKNIVNIVNSVRKKRRKRRKNTRTVDKKKIINQLENNKPNFGYQNQVGGGGGFGFNPLAFQRSTPSVTTVVNTPPSMTSIPSSVLTSGQITQPPPNPLSTAGLAKESKLLDIENRFNEGLELTNMATLRVANEIDNVGFESEKNKIGLYKLYSMHKQEQDLKNKQIDFFHSELRRLEKLAMKEKDETKREDIENQIELLIEDDPSKNYTVTTNSSLANLSGNISPNVTTYNPLVNLTSGNLRTPPRPQNDIEKRFGMPTLNSNPIIDSNDEIIATQQEPVQEPVQEQTFVEPVIEPAEEQTFAEPDVVEPVQEQIMTDNEEFDKIISDEQERQRIEEEQKQEQIPKKGREEVLEEFRQEKEAKDKQVYEEARKKAQEWYDTGIKPSRRVSDLVDSIYLDLKLAGYKKEEEDKKRMEEERQKQIAQTWYDTGKRPRGAVSKKVQEIYNELSTRRPLTSEALQTLNKPTNNNSPLVTNKSQDSSDDDKEDSSLKEVEQKDDSVDDNPVPVKKPSLYSKIKKSLTPSRAEDKKPMKRVDEKKPTKKAGKK